MKGRQRKSKRSGISTLSFSPEYGAEAKKAEEIAKYLAGSSVLHDANAASTMRNRIEELFPTADQSPPAWNISTIVILLEILTSLLDETTSQPVTRNSSEVERATAQCLSWACRLRRLKGGLEVVDYWSGSWGQYIVSVSK